MKRFIPLVAVVTVMTACNSKPEPLTLDASRVQTQQPASNLTAEDSLVLSQFRAWKAENELSDAREFLNGGEAQSNQVVTNTSRNTSVARRSSSSGSRTASRSSSGSGTTAQRKKGWSSAAKGAVIGGVAGAAGGAVINKRNRAAGAVIGGILGAGVGYGIGRSKDVKNGRY